MGKLVPDRWIDYTKIGKVVEGTSFIPFKVPLHDRICENLPETARHTTRDIIEALPNVGLVINLTNTQKGTKYYEPNDWKSEGIDYKWIKVEGHVTPSQHLLVQFCHVVKQYMLTNPSKFIGIHCTHGLNRTGYFVCSYMVLVLSIPPAEAIKRFSEARGYDIERENYINSINLHDSNTNLKQMANTLPVSIPRSSVAIKRDNQTEIDNVRYDDHKRRNVNRGDFRRPNDQRSWWNNNNNNHGSSRNYHARQDDSRSRHGNYYKDNRQPMHSERTSRNRSRDFRDDYHSVRHHGHSSRRGYNNSRERYNDNQSSSRSIERSWKRNHSPLSRDSRSDRNKPSHSSQQ